MLIKNRINTSNYKVWVGFCIFLLIGRNVDLELKLKFLLKLMLSLLLKCLILSNLCFLPTWIRCRTYWWILILLCGV
jgi:hypothetical protein